MKPKLLQPVWFFLYILKVSGLGYWRSRNAFDIIAVILTFLTRTRIAAFYLYFKFFHFITLTSRFIMFFACASFYSRRFHTYRALVNGKHKHSSRFNWKHNRFQMQKFTIKKTINGSGRNFIFWNEIKLHGAFFAEDNTRKNRMAHKGAFERKNPSSNRVSFESIELLNSIFNVNIDLSRRICKCETIRTRFL